MFVKVDNVGLILLLLLAPYDEFHQSGFGLLSTVLALCFALLDK